MMSASDAPALRNVSATVNVAVEFSFDNTYVHLPPRFFVRQDPVRVAAPRLVRVNVELAERLGLDPSELTSPDGVEVLSGNRLPSGAEPMALAYAGHQFGHFVPQLGDGRAVLLGEVVGRDGMRRDIQLKGSGQTPFSRRGDGRAALGPVLREYIVSEAMAALGVPTTRALAAVTTGEAVFRETALPGAVLTRVAASHVRIGTFQFFAAQGDWDAVRVLADYVIARHYPEAAGADHRYRALLTAIVARQADLIARWLHIGFVHGVMNTDNVSIAGETLDYGPCAFMEAYDPATVFSSIDQLGRYAYGRQPGIAQWNLARLSEALLPLLAEDRETALAAAGEALSDFAARFEAAYQLGLRRKIGLFVESEGDAALTRDLLTTMAENGADFTLTFRRLCAAAAAPQNDAAVGTLFADTAAFEAWALRWRRRLAQESMEPQARCAAMQAVNPAVIARNHLVEAAIGAAVEHDDFRPFEDLVDVLSRPYEDKPGLERYIRPADPSERVTQTFCGT